MEAYLDNSATTKCAKRGSRNSSKGYVRRLW